MKDALTTTTLAVHLLGAPAVKVDGQPVEFDTRKAVALLAYLAVSGERQTRDALAGLLWPEYDQSNARAALRRTLSTLNKAVGAEWLDSDRESVALRRGPGLWLDVAVFRGALAECPAHGQPSAAACAACLPRLSQAVAVYHDDFLAGFTLRDSQPFEEWQFFQAETLRRELAAALERLAHCFALRHEYEPAIAHARRRLALDPLHEPAHRALMRLYASAGQWASAVRQYRECVRVLQAELGVAPLEETVRLYEAIRQNRAPSETPAVPGALPALEPPTPPASVSSPPTSGRGALPLVGRETELQTLVSLYAGVRANGHFVVLEGEAGIGKTRLAEALLDHARARGARVLAVGCYEGQANLAYAPFADLMRAALGVEGGAEGLPSAWLAQVARLGVALPDGAATAAPPLDSPGAQVRFFEAVHQVLLTAGRGEAPGVLFLDDLHWADDASIDLLTYIVRRAAGRPLLILAAWRSEPAPPVRLRALLAEARRSGAASLVPLVRLTLPAVAELARAVRADQGEGVERLYRVTEGLPFFLVEYLNASVASDGADDQLPTRARDLLEARLLAVGAAERQLLQAAAVMGRSFDFETLREASGRSEEEAVAGLEALMGAGLIREARGATPGSLRYDFSHQKLRDLVYEETSLTRRRLLHRRIAEALITRVRGHKSAGPLAALIAQHAQTAGEERLAADYYKLAGDYERTLYANRAALDHYRAALALGYPQAESLHTAIGDLHTLLGEYAAALAGYETAAALASSEHEAAIEHKLALVRHRRGEWERAESHFRAAIAALDEQPTPLPEQATLYADWALTARSGGDKARARELADRAYEVAAAASHAPALARAHNLLGVLATDEGRLDEAIEHLAASLALAERLDDPAGRAAALNNLALAYRQSGDLARALSLTQQALALCVAQGDRHHEAALHNNLADLSYALGQPEAALAHVRQAVAINAQIAQETGDLHPEIWKLTEW